jgi:O-antigen/teichoic acid export membrane protein
MIKTIQKLVLGNLLIKGSAIVLISSTLANFGNYLFHLLMGRFLGPADYGVLESLISITYFLGIPVTVLMIVVTKFVSRELEAKKKVALFVKKISGKTAIFGAVALIVFLCLFPWLRALVRVENFFLFLGIGLSSYFGIFLAIWTASFQGILKFFKLGVLSIINSWSKLIIALILIFLGLKVGAGILAIVLGAFLAVVFGYLMLRREIPLQQKGEINIKASFEGIGGYTWAVLVSNLALTSFYTIDIILARYFLSPVEAGQYAALSILGKIVFFASSPINSVMFPVVSSRQAKGENYQKIVTLSLALVALLCGGISLVYFLFPQIMIGLLFGQEYLASTRFLGFFGIFISLYSIASLLTNFFLSISRTKIIVFPALLALVQLVLIFFYHQGIDQILFVNIMVMIALILGLLAYLLTIYRQAGGRSLAKV